MESRVRGSRPGAPATTCCKTCLTHGSMRSGTLRDLTARIAVTASGHERWPVSRRKICNTNHLTNLTKWPVFFLVATNG